MPKYACSYAYDISCYADFTVVARNARAAQSKIDQALKQGRFEDVSAEPCWENGTSNERVFVMAVAAPNSSDPRLNELAKPARKGRTVPKPRSSA